MTNESLIQLAISVLHPHQIDDATYGRVACALLTTNGNTYTGVCIDTISGMGFCAEHNAIGNMITNREYEIKKIVAIGKNNNDEFVIMHPCGRCREFMQQVNNKNKETDVIVDQEKTKKLKELLPYENDFASIIID